MSEAQYKLVSSCLTYPSLSLKWQKPCAVCLQSCWFELSPLLITEECLQSCPRRLDSLSALLKYGFESGFKLRAFPLHSSLCVGRVAMTHFSPMRTTLNLPLFVMQCRKIRHCSWCCNFFFFSVLNIKEFIYFAGVEWTFELSGKYLYFFIT